MPRFRLVMIAGFAAILLALVTPPRITAQVPGAIPLGERPPGDVAFVAPQVPVWPEDTDTPGYSLCLGTAPAMPNNQECGGDFHPSTTVQGGKGPYHFQLDSGWGFPPFGIHLDKDGNLRGKLAKGARAATFRVCAVDLVGAQSCQNVTINPGPAVAPQKAAKQESGEPSHGMNPALKWGLIGGGAAAAVFAICQPNEVSGCPGPGGDNGTNGSASCGSVPTMPSPDCVGISRNSSICNAWVNSYRSWCTCNGRTFDVNRGSCS